MFWIHLEPDWSCFFSNLKINRLPSLNKWTISSSKSLSSSNKIAILSKSSKDTNEAFSVCNPNPCMQYACSLLSDVIDLFCDLKLFKAINRNYFDVADSLIIIPRMLTMVLSIRNLCNKANFSVKVFGKSKDLKKAENLF